MSTNMALVILALHMIGALGLMVVNIMVLTMFGVFSVPGIPAVLGLTLNIALFLFGLMVFVMVGWEEWRAWRERG